MWRGGVLIGLIIFNLSNVYAVELEIKKTNDVLSFQFYGKESWDFQVSNEKEKINIRVPKLSPKSIENLNKSKENIGLIAINTKDSNLYDIIVIQNKDKLETFEYLLKNPSRLVVDLFKNIENKVETTPKKPLSDDKKMTTLKKRQNRETSVNQVRSPANTDILEIKSGDASDENLIQEASIKQIGLLDGADFDFERLKVPKSELRNEAKILFRLNDYLDFPFMQERLTVLESMKKNRPEYQISSETRKKLNPKEIEMMDLLIQLFKNKRYFVFFKTAKWFEEKYPKSDLEELLRGMWADAHYNLYLEDNEKYRHHLGLSRTRFEEMIEKYPKSILIERTLLFMANSSLEDQDYLSSLRWFQRHVDQFKNSESGDHARLGVIRSLVGASQFPEAEKEIENLKKTYCKDKSQCLLKAELLKGDIYIVQKNWDKANEIYNSIETQFLNEAALEERYFYNKASISFKLNDFEKSLDQYLDFIKRFPSDIYAGYALTRMGEIMDLISTNPNRSLGAYLEAYFRYGITKGSTAIFARVRMLQKQLYSLEGRAQKNAIEEIKNICESSGLKNSKDFSNFIISSVLLDKKQFDEAASFLVKPYQENPSSELAPRYLEKIQNIYARKVSEASNVNPLKTLELHTSLSETWLKNKDRIDINYAIAQSYYSLGAYEQSLSYFLLTKEKLAQLNQVNEENSIIKLTQFPPLQQDVDLKIVENYLKLKKWNEAYQVLSEIEKNQTDLSYENKIKKSSIASQLLVKKGQSEYALRHIQDLRGIASVKEEERSFDLLIYEMNALQALEKDKEVLSYAKEVNELCKKFTIKKEMCLESNKIILASQKKLLPKEDYVVALSQFINKFDSEPYFDSYRYELGYLFMELKQTTKAEVAWGQIKETQSNWSKLAKSHLDQIKFNEKIKNYKNQIPTLGKNSTVNEGVKNE